MFFKNVKLMFWGDVVVCATYLRNRSPSDLMLLNTRLHMNRGLDTFLWLGILDFFWFHLLCLETKGAKKQTWC